MTERNVSKEKKPSSLQGWIGFCFAVAINLIATVLFVIGPSVPLEAGRGVRGYYILMSLFVGAIGGLILSRYPRHGIGRVFTALGIISALIALIQEYTYLAVFGPPGIFSGGELAAWLWSWIWILGTPLLFFIPLLFPDGDLPSPRWKPLIWLGVANAFLSALAGAVLPGPLVTVSSIDNPFGLEPMRGPIETIMTVTDGILLGIFLLAAFSMYVRYRKAQAAQRQQIKWFVFSVLLFAMTSSTSSQGFPWYLISAAAFVLIPISIVLAIYRYRLYDIDIIIRRTLQYSLLSALLAFFYFGGILILQAILGPAMGESDSPLITVVTTLMIAALFNPLRIRLQDFIDRRFFRRKYDAEKALESFSVSMRDEVDLEILSVSILKLIDETMQPNQSSLFLKSDR